MNIPFHTGIDIEDWAEYRMEPYHIIIMIIIRNEYIQKKEKVCSAGVLVPGGTWPSRFLQGKGRQLRNGGENGTCIWRKGR